MPYDIREVRLSEVDPVVEFAAKMGQVLEPTTIVPSLSLAIWLDGECVGAVIYVQNHRQPTFWIVADKPELPIQNTIDKALMKARSVGKRRCAMKFVGMDSSAMLEEADYMRKINDCDAA